MPLLVVSGSVKSDRLSDILQSEALIAKSSLLFLIVQNSGAFTKSHTCPPNNQPREEGENLRLMGTRD
ncbi:MAG: hypothetical protein KME23_21630 [Goleter apudmare HA4340-LM2]|nr:hypothetical protein [Goleter apudmare HA4340-LM2]